MKFKIALISNLVAQAINLLLGLFCLPIYLDILDLYFLGIWNLIVIVFAWGLILEFGIPNLLLRQLKLEIQNGSPASDINKLISNSKTILLILNSVILFFVFLATISIPPLKQLVGQFNSISIIAIFLCMLLKNLDILNRQILIANEFYVKSNMIIVMGSFARHGTALYLFFSFPINHNLLVWPIVLSTVISFLASSHFSFSLTDNKVLKLKSISLNKDGINFSMGFFITNLGSLITMQADKIFLASFASVEKLALYGLAFTPAALVYSISIPVQNALYPQLLRLYQKDPKLIPRATYICSSSVLISQISIWVFILFFGEYFLGLWLKNDDLISSINPLFQLLVVANICGCTSGLIFTYGNVFGQVKIMSTSSFISPVGVIICLYPFYSMYGINGIGIAWVFVELVGLLFYSFYTFIGIKISFYFFSKALRDALFVFVFTYAFLWLLDSMEVRTEYCIFFGLFAVSMVTSISYKRIEKLFIG